MPNSIENKEALRSLKTLVRSQTYQLEKLNETNKKIEKLNNELKGGLYQEEKREAVKNFAGPGKNSKLNK